MEVTEAKLLIIKVMEAKLLIEKVKLLLMEMMEMMEMMKAELLLEWRKWRQNC